MGEPLSLVHPEFKADDSPVEALHFTVAEATGETEPADRPPQQTPVAAGGSNDRATGEVLTDVGSPPDPASSVVVPLPLLDLRTWLVRQAERGTGASTPGAVLGDLVAHHRRVRAIGLSVFPAEASEDDVAVRLLRSHYLVQQVTALLAGDSDLDGDVA